MRKFWSSDDEEWDAEEPTNMSIDPDIEKYYWEAVNAETIASPIIRTFDEWQKLSEPLTEDDLIDTMLFIKRLPNVCR